MSLGTSLDVVIGLVFTYLLLGTIASGVQEAWVALINKRGKELQAGVAQLLSGTGTVNLDQGVLSHSLLADLSPKNKPPSYVPARNFALAVIDTLRAGGSGPLFSEVEKAVAALPAGSAKQSLTTFITDASGDIATLQKSIETWFDDAMDRVSGIYKRYVQRFTLAFGLAVAIVFNVDSINLAYTLWTNSAIRDAVAAQAQSTMQQKQAAPGPTVAVPSATAAAPSPTATAPNPTTPTTAPAPQLSVQNAENLLIQLPVGWVATPAETANGLHSPGQLFWARLGASNGSGIWILLGWAITALATSLGAPFWFDALSNLLRLRHAGPKPPRSDAPAATA